MVTVTTETPAFLDLSPEEMAAWRDLPVTKCFLEWLDYEHAKAKTDVAQSVLFGRVDDARIHCGTMLALQNIADRATSPALLPGPPTKADEPFFDAATRPSLRGR